MWLCAFESGIVSIQYIRYLFYASKLGKSCGSWSRPFLGGLKKKGAPRDAAAFFFFLFLLIRFDRIIRCLGRPPCLFFVSDFAANPLHFFVFLIRRRQWRRWILTRWLAATFIHRSSDLELWILKPRLLLGGIGFGAKRVWWTSSSLFFCFGCWMADGESRGFFFPTTLSAMRSSLAHFHRLIPEHTQLSSRHPII